MSDEDKSREELIAELEQLRGDVQSVMLAAITSERERPDFVAAAASFHQLLEGMRAVLIALDADGKVMSVTPSIAATLGYGPDEVLGMHSDSLLHEDERARMVPLRRRIIAGHGPESMVYRAQHKDGRMIWMEMSAIRYEFPDGSVGVTALARDVTDVQDARAEVEEINLRHRILASASRDLVSESDDQGRFVYLSDTCSELLGYEASELLGTVATDLFHPDDFETLSVRYRQELERGGSARMGDFRVRHKDGGWRWCVGTGIPYQRADGRTYTIGTLRDITHRREAENENARLQERIQRAQRLEGLGIMAGGVAHDFNNLLTPILGQAALAIADLAPGTPIRRRLEQIQRTAVQAAALTHQMLTYSGQGPMQVEPVDLSKLVREMYEMLETGLSHNAEVDLDLEPGLPPIDADPTQISQVVMNLLSNASEAMTDRAGRIGLRTGTERGAKISAQKLVVGEPVASREYVFVAVSDSGIGMHDETRARIFDPFFTTKFTGRGLGLAAAAGIVRSHDGCIELESVPGEGTRFRVLLPSGNSENEVAVRERASAAPWQHSGLVLVADDDEAVRELECEALSRCGLTTLEAGTGREAIEVLRQRGDQICAAVIDRTMPDLSGDEARQAIRDLVPELPILLVSGYSRLPDSGQPTDGPPSRYDGFLAKPFLPDALVDAVRALIEDGEQNRSRDRSADPATS